MNKLIVGVIYSYDGRLFIYLGFKDNGHVTFWINLDRFSMMYNDNLLQDDEIITDIFEDEI